MVKELVNNVTPRSSQGTSDLWKGLKFHPSHMNQHGLLSEVVESNQP